MSRSLRFRSVDEMPASMRKLVPHAPDAVVAEPRRKYGNKVVHHDGIRFDSIREMNYYKLLVNQRERGEIAYFLRQVPIHLPGGTKLVIDFQVHHNDGRVEYVDAKGRETAAFKIKRREVHHHYPFRIKCV